MKKKIYHVLQTNRFIEWLIIWLIVLSVISVFLDTFSNIATSVVNGISIIDNFTMVVFTIEYLLRLWTAPYLYPDLTPRKARLTYICSFMAVVDFLAILPFHLPFFLPHLNIYAFRMVRMIRLLRIFKINRYTHALSSIGKVIRKKAMQLISAIVLVFILLIVASVLMYYVENPVQPDVYKNAFSGLWWAVITITTVGYGDIFPITALGQVIGGFFALLGVGLVAIPTGIISAGFMEDITESVANEREEGRKEKHYCPYCGKYID